MNEWECGTTSIAGVYRDGKEWYIAENTKYPTCSGTGRTRKEAMNGLLKSIEAYERNDTQDDWE